MADSSANFNLKEIYDTLLPRMKRSEQQMRVILDSNSGDQMTSQDLIITQAKLQEWTLMSQLNSNLIKEIGDTLKSIVQKAA